MGIRSFAVAGTVMTFLASAAFAGQQTTPNAPPPAQTGSGSSVSSTVSTGGGGNPNGGTTQIQIVNATTAIVTLGGQTFTVTGPNVAVFLSIYAR